MKKLANLSIEKAKANAMEEDGDKPVAHVEYRDRAKEEVPEPENQVDLLIDDVLQEE